MVELKHSTLGLSNAKEMKKEEKVIAEVRSPEDDLRSLIELGCIRETVEIEGMKFVMRSLSSSDALELSKFMDGLGEEAKEEEVEEKMDWDKVFKFRNVSLAMAIETVNGRPLEDLYTGDASVAPLQKKIIILSNMQTPVLDKLLKYYNDLIDRSNNQYTEEQVKN